LGKNNSSFSFVAKMPKKFRKIKYCPVPIQLSAKSVQFLKKIVLEIWRLKDPTQKHSFFAILENTYKNRHPAKIRQRKKKLYFSNGDGDGFGTRV
jgi:hypothetical protein